MNDILVDTHIAVWAMYEPARLSAAAVLAIQNAQAAGGRILVSAITPVEVTYLTEKGKLDPAVLPGLWAALDDPIQPLDLTPVSRTVARSLGQIPRTVVPDMPDRIISATALALAISVVSADARIRALTVPGLVVIW